MPRITFAENLLTNQKFKEMDKIFKNDKIMGLVALLTFILVAWMAYDKYKSEKALALPAEE